MDCKPRDRDHQARESLAKKYGLTETVFDYGDFEVDGCLLRFKKPEIALEVKWKRLSKDDIKKAERNLGRIKAKGIIFVQKKEGVESSLKVMDVDDL